MTNVHEMEAYRMLRERTPLHNGGGGGTSGDVTDAPTEAPWESRVSRLEMGFCAAFVLVFAAIITSYLMLAGKIDDGGDRLANVSSNVQVLSTKSDASNQRLDAIDHKLDSISDKLDRRK